MPEADSNDLTLVGEYPDARSAADRALVVLALGRPCWLLPGNPTTVRLLVEPADRERVQAELDLYEAEQKSTPQPPEEMSATFWAPALYAWGLAVAALFQSRAPQDAFARGAVSHATVWQQGEWGRCLLALTLHGNLPHLISNLAFGLLFLVPLMRLIGPGAGLWAFALSGTLGNGLNSALRQTDDAFSIGASTGVFGVLGTLVAVQMSIWQQTREPWQTRTLLVPLGGGLGLLALLGSQPSDGLGGAIDHTAHLAGFFAGLVIGPLLARLPKTLRSGRGTAWLTWSAPLPFLAAWAWASR